MWAPSGIGQIKSSVLIGSRQPRSIACGLPSQHNPPSGMQFHLGKAIGVMLVLAAISGTGLLLRPPEPHADLTLWVFAESHRAEYRRLLPTFRRSTGKTVRLDLVTVNALNVRLASLFMS